RGQRVGTIRDSRMLDAGLGPRCFAELLEARQLPGGVGRARIDVVILEAVAQAGNIQPGPGRRLCIGRRAHSCVVPTLGMVSNSTLASLPSTFSTRRMYMFWTMSRFWSMEMGPRGLSDLKL